MHEIDIALYFMGATAPKSMMASGGKLAYPDDASETPDTLQTVFEYDNFNMLWEHATGIENGNYGKTEGIAFIGNYGTMVVNREGWEIIPETKRNDQGILMYEIEDLPDQRRSGNANYLAEHLKNFTAAMRAAHRRARALPSPLDDRPRVRGAGVGLRMAELPTRAGGPRGPAAR